MSGGPFTFATLYMVRAQICKERKIYVLEKAFSNVRLPCGSNDADTGADGTPRRLPAICTQRLVRPLYYVLARHQSRGQLHDWNFDRFLLLRHRLLDEHQQPAIWTMPPHFTGVLMSNVVHATRLRTAIGVPAHHHSTLQHQETSGLELSSSE